MHRGINFAVISFLINDEAFRACFDDRNIIRSFHWPDFDRDRRKIRRERAHAFREIILTNEFRMLARDEQNLAKTLRGQMPRFRAHLIEIERDAQDRIVARKSAVTGSC